MVDLLRAEGHLSISLVAEEHEAVVGHIAFSPVRVDGETVEEVGIGLAPLAVLPDYQRRASAADSSARAWRRANGPDTASWSCWASRRFIDDSASIGPIGGASGMNTGPTRTFMVLELSDGAIPGTAAWSGSGPSSPYFAI